MTATDLASVASLPSEQHNQLKVFGLSFTSMTMPELVATLASASLTQVSPAQERSTRIVFTANLDHIVRLQRDSDLRAAYNRATIVTADGFPVYLYAKLRGATMPERITGSDLVPRLIAELTPERHRCYFLASRPEIGHELTRLLMDQGFKKDQIRFSVPPFGFEYDAVYAAQVTDDIKRHQTTHLFLGVGCPKSERWVAQNSDALGNCTVLCVGAALEYYVGFKRRAPTVLQKLGLEWLWRFGQEPRRLFHRYFVDSWLFFSAIKEDLQPIARRDTL